MGAKQSTADSTGYSPPLSPSEPPSPSSSPSPKRRSSLRASFFWSTSIAPILDAEPEPLPPPIEITRLDVPRNDNHPYQSYRVSRKIGHGGFAVVYTGHKAENVQEKVAIKEIDTSKLSPQRLEDLNIEMNILSQLNHENIVRLYAVYMLNDKIYMIMEYLKGGELLQAICQREYYSEGDARKLLRQIASALYYMHIRQVIHRDIKPENLILQDVSFNSPVKLVDFGFSTTLQHVQSNPNAYLCGTRGYLAPEVIKDRKYSVKSDVFSMGVVFYIMLSGLMPYRASKDGEADVLAGNFSFPPVRFGAVSKMAKDLIAKMMHIDPEKRLTAKQVLDHPWTKLGGGSESTHMDADITGNLESIRMHRRSTRKGSGFWAMFFGGGEDAGEDGDNGGWCCSSTSAHISPTAQAREMPNPSNKSLEQNFKEHIATTPFLPSDFKDPNGGQGGGLAVGFDIVANAGEGDGGDNKMSYDDSSRVGFD